MISAQQSAISVKLRRHRGKEGSKRREPPAPFIALIAKAMGGDREICLEAGASDDISKPVDVGQLLALLRVWLDRTAAR